MFGFQKNFIAYAKKNFLDCGTISSLHPYGPDSCVRAAEPRARASGGLPCRKMRTKVRVESGKSVGIVTATV